MNGRDALGEKFCAVCAERVREARRLLGEADGPTDHRVRNALGELHTIKGEGAMVGCETISKLAHGLESILAARRDAESFMVADVCHALEIIEDAVCRPWPSVVHDPGLLDLLTEIESATSPGAAPPSVQLSLAAPSPAPARAAPARSRAAEVPSPTARFARVEAARVDAVCEELGELTLKLARARARLSSVAIRAVDGEQASALRGVIDELESACAAAEQTASAAWALRLVPLEPALRELVAHAGKLAQEQAKELDVEVIASGVELERTLIEEVREPLLHILRNSVDHGIEAPAERRDKPRRGTLRCTAEAHGASVLLCVEDDGAGMDVDAIRARAVALELVDPARASVLSPPEVLDLVFLPGFTERDRVTELSGRGVGLSVARRKVEALGGTIRVSSELGRHTRFELHLPSTLSRERVLLVEAGELVCGVPARWVRAVLREDTTLERAIRQRHVRFEGRTLPVRSLMDWFGLAGGEPNALVVLEIGELTGALLVTQAVRQQDLLRRPGDALLSWAARVAASGVLEDGRLVLIPRWAEVLREPIQRGAPEARQAPVRGRSRRVLVVDDSPVVRDIVGDILSSAGLEVELVSNGASALERILATDFDLVISDVEMPRMNGFELLERIRRHSELLPVIMLTTRSAAEDRRRAATLGASGYVVKSEFHGETLLDVVRRFVELPG